MNFMKKHKHSFLFLSFIALAILWFIAPWILGVFGASYQNGAGVMRIFLVGSLGAHLLRVPFGNLLSAVGKADWNTYINVIVLLLTVLACWYFIPLYGINGAAMATLISLIVWNSITTLLIAACFKKLIKYFQKERFFENFFF